MTDQTKACSNCAYRGEIDFVDRLKSGFPTKKAVCRRNPPQALVNGNGVAQALWPMVEPADWCGQWEPKDSVAPVVSMTAKQASRAQKAAQAK